MAAPLLEDFGQRVDLTRRIREILANYPEGTTVLKELIQNADDAGATTVRLCLDRRCHGTATLLSPELAQWQGPALIAYNDAIFSEEDFASISRIGDSKKQGQAWKTGRFGVGFNSVYHLTDLPSFVSGKYAVIFDPQGAYLPNVSSANPGKRLDFVNSSAISHFRDQFAPYCAFDCDMEKAFHGTLFRFPLRSADQAAVSKLSNQVYLEDDISHMFSELYKEAIFSLLFLKSVLSIEMYVWEATLKEPQKLYSCAVVSLDEKTAHHRQALLRFSVSDGLSKWQMDSFSLDFLSESVFETKVEKRIDTFFIVQGLASASSGIGCFATAAARDYSLQLLPWASVAACISDGLPEETLKQGHAFCSLPLPVRTGLAVQVNGYFEVSSNRRGIWYGDDMDRIGRLRSDWNVLLLEDVVAPAFRELLLGVRNRLGPSQLYYSLWPSGSFEEPWNSLVKRIYDDIWSASVLYSNVEGGKWIAPLEAFVHDEDFVKSKDLAQALVSLGMPIVHLPSVLVDKLFQYSKDRGKRVVCPRTVHYFMTKRCKSAEKLERSHKLILLDYVLGDLNDADVSKYVDGLPLLPLANGEFGTICANSHDISYFMCNEPEYKLLSVVPEQIIDRCISPDLFHKLSVVAKSSRTNLKLFDEQCFLQVLPRFFPSDWKHRKRVTWDPQSNATCVTEGWFVLFWQYLQEQCYDLSIFNEWPILPTISGCLNTALEFPKLVNAESLPSTIKSILSKIGCELLEPKYGIKHQQLYRYVYEGNASGVLNSVVESVPLDSNDLETRFQDLSAGERNGLRLFLLDPKWYYGGTLSNIDIKNCKRLPIFEVYDEEHHLNGFHDLEKHEKYLPPLNVPGHFLGCDFIRCRNPTEDEILLKYYGVERMNRTKFYQMNVLNKLNQFQPQIRDNVMLSILQELPQLSAEDLSFKEHLKTVKFVPTINGNLESPRFLYDPRVTELYSLLEGSHYFPSGMFQESSVLDTLLLLGLQTSVSADTILKSARQIESLMHKDQLKASLRGKVLLAYLEVNALKWLLAPSVNGQRVMESMFSSVSAVFRPRDMPPEDDWEKFWNDLKMISWCPVLVTSPHSALPWPLVSSMVAPPKLVRLQTDMWLASASSRVLDGECSSSALSQKFGWSSPPGGSIIAAQLLELGKNNEIVTDALLRQELAMSMPKAYNLLTNLIGSDEMDIVKAVLEGCRWIWVGDGFAKADEVVLTGQLHLAPYIRVIPVDLAVFKELFLELGIQEYLKSIDYANILCRMARRRGKNPLDAEELRAAMLVVQHLSEVQSQDLQVQIYLPDTSSRLLLATDLVFNDAPWLLDVGDTFGDSSDVVLNSKRSAHKFVHGNISNDMAEKLGARSLRRLLLAESSDSMNLSLSGVAEAFGQHEALTTRLKHIVEMYADGPGILFELVQNAEDARASEVVFLLDKTHYGTSSILSPDMAEWQGPALYCFNNAVFTAQDLYAISRIGQDSKLEKPFAIGRFGLGFNCVYHFTDIPSFISGDNIVIFDPHACYLPGISPSHPGLRIKFVGGRILEQFPDQFSPFCHFGCDFRQPYPGTLFRFPLRSESAASRSQIKKEKYAPEDVELLFSSFSTVVSESLLFLRNISSVSIFVKDGADQDMQLIHRVSRQVVSASLKEPQLVDPMLEFIHGKQNKKMDRDMFFSKLGKTMEKDLPWRCEKVAILEHSPLGRTSHHWMISECIGGGHAKSKSLYLANKSQNFIPWASVAAYLNSVSLQDENEGSFSARGELEPYNFGDVKIQPSANSTGNRKEFEGRAFCFLPLPVSTGLPAHINAYFELSSNRRDLWFGNDMSGGGRTRSEWNMSLLEDAVAPAYSRLLSMIAKEMDFCDLFFSYWPTTMGTEPWATLVHKLYRSIADYEFPVLYTNARGGQWISTRQAIFPDFKFSKAYELSEGLSEAGLPLVTISRQIVDQFMEACPSLHFLNPQLLRILLIRRKRDFKSKGAIIIALEYCLSDIKGDMFPSSLQGLPLVPLANGSFATLDKRGEGERMYITCPKEYDLLKQSIPHLIVDQSVPIEVFKKLQDIAHSGKFNISNLTCKSFVDLLPCILPNQWQNARKVSWTPGHQGQPSLEWMGLFWSYLKSSCTDLAIFSNWPILPVANDFLLQLSENSSVIRNEGWNENMCSLLQKVGCFMLRFDLAIDHPQLKDFVQDASASGFLNAVQAIFHSQDMELLFTSASRGEMHELRSFLLQSKWFSGEQLSSTQINLIKQLPIFETYGSKELISLVNPEKWLKPEGVSEDLLNGSIVRTESEREKRILKSYLGVREPSKAEFYKGHVLNHMSSFLSLPVILSEILNDVKIIGEEDISLKNELLHIPFVLAANGSWQSLYRLYDPRVPALKHLLHKEAFFPGDMFLDDKVLDILVCLGLKRDLSYTGLIDSARSVAMLHNSGMKIDALAHGQKLLVFLNALGHVLDVSVDKMNPKSRSLMSKCEHCLTATLETKILSDKCCEGEQDLLLLSNIIFDISEDEFWLEIKSIPWCPVHVTSPIAGLPWFTSDDCIASPNITRPKAQMWSVSSKMRILDGECCSTYLQTKLGWMAPPGLHILSNQLLELSKLYKSLKMYSGQDFLDCALHREIPSIYAKLQDYVGSGDLEELRSDLNGVPWVWIGDDFVTTKALAFDSPVKYHPYLYVVPTELSEYRDLLSKLGVRPSFESIDYLQVLQCLQRDLKGEPLSSEQLCFVQRVLEALVDCSADKQILGVPMNPILVPNASGVLMYSSDLVYDDAPWMTKSSPLEKNFVHASIRNDLAKLLGVQSLGSLSLVDEGLTRELPCLDFAKTCELLALYGDVDLLPFDLIELADSSNAKKLHLIYDKREHPRQSLLQQNLGDFQCPSLTIVIEGCALSTEEVCSLQFPPPWTIRGGAINYGLGLISSYAVCDVLTIVSGGYFYIFDPLGLAIAAPTSSGPSAKLFSLTGTDLTERFRDQFIPMLMNQGFSTDSTIIRMPLSSRFASEPGTRSRKLKQIFDSFKSHASATLLFLKSVFQVSILTWEEEKMQPSFEYSVSIDPSYAVPRNPFSEKKWRKFQISRLFGSSTSTTKIHVRDVHVVQEEHSFTDKWLVALCLGAGQTRNMALDRRYLAYNLIPVAGVAALISRNGQPVTVHSPSCILSPLPLSGSISLPVTVLGCFLVCHSGGRYLFDGGHRMNSPGQKANPMNQLVEAWNKELMLCVRDSYVEMIMEFQRLKKEPLTSTIEPKTACAVSSILQAYDDGIYSFWPRSKQVALHNQAQSNIYEPYSAKPYESDWESLVEQVIRPFYARLVEIPVWQLYGGSLVKADEGMFLSQSEMERDNPPPDSVFSFIREHYPVFSVPWELVSEIQAVGVKVREIKPNMVRSLLKSSTSVSVQSVEAYVGVLDYCLSNVPLKQLTELLTSDQAEMSSERSMVDTLDGGFDMVPYSASSSSSSSNILRLRSQNSVDNSKSDAFEVFAHIGRALYDFGRVVVDDVSMAGGSSSQLIMTESTNTHAGKLLRSVADELKGIPIPTATKHFAKLGKAELWVGNKEEQLLMQPLSRNFINQLCLEKPFVFELLSNKTIQPLLKLKQFSPHLLSSHLRFLFSEYWIRQVNGSGKAPWIPWDPSTSAKTESHEPTPDWIRLFWNVFKSSNGDVSLVSDWPLIPGFLIRPVLCRVEYQHLIFVPPIADSNPTVQASTSDGRAQAPDACERSEEHELLSLYLAAFEVIKTSYPWLLPVLNQFKIPVFDMSFLDQASPLSIFPAPGQSIGQVLIAKLLASKQAGYFTIPSNLSDENRENLFNLLASNFQSSDECAYRREELDVLRQLPIYKTVLGNYTQLSGSEHCIVSPASFFHPKDECCLSCSTNDVSFFHALGVNQLNDLEILMKFALPEFGEKTQEEQEKILLYLYTNWNNLQLDSTVVSTLKGTSFVQSAAEGREQLFRPLDLLDPHDSILTSIFYGDPSKFPGGRFTTDGWLCILRKTGLRTSLQVDTIIECAQKLEMLGRESMTYKDDHDDFDAQFSSSKNEVSFDLWYLAESLVGTIFANFASLYDNAFCERLSKIAFVPAEKGLPSIGGKKGGKRVLCSYSEAILLKDWPLAWSSAPILGKVNSIPPEYSWGAFHFMSPPAFSTVLKHLQVIGRNNGEETLARWPTSSGMLTIEDASFEILNYLDKVWSMLSSTDIEELQKVAFVPVANGTRLVTAKSLFVHLPINLSPFAFELPTRYLPFVKILKHIGMQEVFSVAYARDILLNIQKHCGYQRLNPNELRAVLEILKFICDGSRHVDLDGSDWSSDAIVLDDGCRLVSAKSCVYIDTEASRFLCKIDTSMLRFVHPDISENICMGMGIKKLSDIVVEVLDDGKPLQLVDQIDSVQINQIRDKLLSKSLHTALLILISGLANVCPSFEGLTLLRIQNILHSIASKLQFVENIYTRFLLLPRRLDITRMTKGNAILEWYDGIKHRTVYFVDKSITSVLIAHPPAYLSVCDVIAIAVSQVLGTPAVLAIGPLFTCQHGKEPEILDLLKLGSEREIMKQEGKNNINVGMELLPQDARQVQFLPSRPFYTGEIVAWKTGKDGDKLRYGRVPDDVRPSAGQPLYKFPVEVAPGETQILLSSQVFSFRSISIGELASAPSLSESIDINRNLVPNNQQLRDARNRSVPLPPQVANDLLYGRMPARELVQAVHDILSSAGIDLDSQKQTLLEKTITLQEEMEQSRVALLVEQEKADAAAKEADAAKAAWSCRVCLSTEVDMTMVPCGHVLCQRCASAISRCPFCRVQVSRTIKIYRP